MNLKLKSFFVLGVSGLFLTSALAHAVGGDTSGGGNAVVCFDDPSIPAQIRDPKNPFFGEVLDSYINGHVTSIEAYDLAEAKLPRGWGKQTPTLFEPLPNEAANDYVERLAKRYEQIVPALADYLRNGMRRFQDANVVAQPHGLSKVDDIGEVGNIDSTNCVVATLATQYNTGDKFSVHYDSRMFSNDKHSEFSRNVLVAHEYLYSEARLRGQTTSRNTRDLLGLMITLNPSMTAQQLLDAAFNLGFITSNKDLKHEFAYPNLIMKISAMLSLISASDDFRNNISRNPATLALLLDFSKRAHNFMNEAVKPLSESEQNIFNNKHSYARSNELGVRSYVSYAQYERALKDTLAIKGLSDKLYRQGHALLNELKQIGGKYYAPIWFSLLKDFNENVVKKIQEIPGLPQASKTKMRKDYFDFIVGIYDVLLGKQDELSKRNSVLAEILVPEYEYVGILNDEYDYNGEYGKDYRRWGLFQTTYNDDRSKDGFSGWRFSRIAGAFVRHFGPSLEYPIP